MATTTEEAIDLFIQLWPSGKLYDWYTRTSDIYNLIAGTAEALKEYGHDFLDNLRAEFNPRTATEKLPDFEAALGLSVSKITSTGTTAQRRNAVISKFRESGAFTAKNVRSILGPLLGYDNPDDLALYETNRADLKALHTYSESPGSAIPDNDPAGVTRTLLVKDGGTVSAAGAQITVTLTHANVAHLAVTLTAPDGTTSKTWSLGTGAASSTVYYLYGKEFAGASIHGNWSLKVVDNSAGTSGTLVAWSIFAEGILQAHSTGGAAFEWGVYADPSLVNSPNYNETFQAIQRIAHANTLGSLLLSVSPRPNEASGQYAAIPNQSIPV